MVSVGVQWVNNFPPPCDQNELNWCDETSVGFANAMRDRGHTVKFNWGDTDAWERDWRDAVSGGADQDPGGGADSVDFVHFSSHGSCFTDNVFRGYFGAQSDACHWRSDKARFGNTQAEYVALDCCRSLDWNVRNLWTVWNNAFQGLHLIFGFKGVCSDGFETGDRGHKFGWRAGGGGNLKNAWLEECYDSYYDDNPVVMVVGRDANDAHFRLNNETLNSNFGDIPRAEIRWWTYAYRD